MHSVQLEYRGQEELKQELAETIPNFMEKLASFIQETLPEKVNNETPVRTRALQLANTVSTAVVPDGVDVAFENLLDYSKFVIEGTSKMYANPYPSRAVDSYGRQLDAWMEELINGL